MNINLKNVWNFFFRIEFESGLGDDSEKIEQSKVMLEEQISQ